MKNTGVGCDGYASVESRADLGPHRRNNPEEVEIVDGARAVGAGASRGCACVPVDEVEFHARATLSAASSAVNAKAVCARILPAVSRRCDRSPTPSPPSSRRLETSSWHPVPLAKVKLGSARGAREDGGAVVVRGWAHAVKPTIESRLADAEAELAFLRADNGRVARENARLRAKCERLSARIAMLSEDGRKRGSSGGG